MSKTLEDLGYEKISKGEHTIFNLKDPKTDTSIVFFEPYRTFCKENDGELAGDITMEELKAIYQYCIDNKWI